MLKARFVVRILIVTAQIPYPPTSGGALRAYGIIYGLHAAGHRISLMSFNDEPYSDSVLSELCEQIITLPAPQRSKKDRLMDVLFTSQADIARRLYDAKFAYELLQLAASDFDLIQFEGIEVGCYIPILQNAGIRTPICFDTFNAEADLQRVIHRIDRDNPRRWAAALYSWIQARRINQYEGELCRRATLVIAVSPEDAAILEQYGVEVAVVSSGIFVDDYTKTSASISLPDPSFVFTGKMDYRPNIDAVTWFADHVLPHISEGHFVIVGQQPHPYVQMLAERSNVTVTGKVESVLPYLHAASIYVAPLRMGSGTRLKLLEAMAAGCAIVATDIAAAGLTEEIRECMVIANDTDDFAEALKVLTKNPERCADLGTRAQAAVRRHYDWSAIIPKLLAAYQGASIG